MRKTIPIEFFERNRACEPHLHLLRQVFPQGGEVSVDKLMVASRLGLNLNWLAEKLLSEQSRFALQMTTARARKEFNRKIAALQKQSISLGRSAKPREYNDHMKAIQSAQCEMQETIAEKFFELFEEDQA